MKHIKMFESMNDEMQSSTFSGETNNRAYVACIAGDNGSAVGVLDAQETEMLNSYMEDNPNSLTMQTFPLSGEDGDFILLTGSGEWRYIKVGRVYNADSGATVFPILGYGQVFVGFNGAQTTWGVGKLSDILKDL